MSFATASSSINRHHHLRSFFFRILPFHLIISISSFFLFSPTMKLSVSSSTSVVLLFVAAFSAVAAYDPCDKAYESCDFRFKYDYRSVPLYDIWESSDNIFTDRIISKDRNENLGVVNSNGITPEFINDDGSVELITDAGKPNFRPTHFKPFYKKYLGGSGIGYQAFQGNQQKVAAGRCIRVFFSMYQVLNRSGSSIVKKNINADRYDNKCVVFQTV